MSTTTALGFVKPGSQNEPADGFGAIGALADSVDTYATARVENLYAGWTSATATWSASGTAVSLGNGTMVVRSLTVGKTVRFAMTLTVGSTTTFGTGNYSFSGLPTAVLEQSMFNGFLYDSSANLYYPAYLPVAAGATTGILRAFSTTAGNAVTTITPTFPVTLANADKIVITGTYEIA